MVKRDILKLVALHPIRRVLTTNTDWMKIWRTCYCLSGKQVYMSAGINQMAGEALRSGNDCSFWPIGGIVAASQIDFSSVEYYFITTNRKCLLMHAAHRSVVNLFESQARNDSIGGFIEFMQGESAPRRHFRIPGPPEVEGA